MSFTFSVLYGQTDTNTVVSSFTFNSPVVLATHPLGEFISRINHNFALKPVTKTSLSIGITNANIWLPEVKEYLPHSYEATQRLSKVVWHKRDSVFQAMQRNYDSTVFFADGVWRVIHLNLRFNLSSQCELAINTKAIWLTGGQQPTALITSDGFIEDFHSNVKGGEDPFARKQYAYNQASLFYQDKTGKKLHLTEGSFIVPNFQLNYYWYPPNNWLKKLNMQTNVGAHIGINLPSFSRSIDAGISCVLIKEFCASKKYRYIIAASGNVLRQKIWSAKSHVDFSRSKALPSIAALFEFKNVITKSKFWAIGLNYYYLAPFHPANEFDEVTPVGNRLSSHWHLAVTHMYRNSQYWSLVYSFGSKYFWSAYLTQDFKVNNAPDFQTGLSIQIPLKEKRIKKPAH